MHLIASSFDDIVHSQIPIWDKVLRTVVVYALIYLLMRLAKRDAAQLTASDFVVVLLLSNVVQNAIIGPDDSLLGGAIGAVTLIVVNELVARWEWRRKRPRTATSGAPSQASRWWWSAACGPPARTRFAPDRGRSPAGRGAPGASASPSSTCSPSCDDKGSGTRTATWIGRRSARAAPSTTSSRNLRSLPRKATSTVSIGSSASSGTRWAGSRRPDGHRRDSDEPEPPPSHDRAYFFLAALRAAPRSAA